MKINIKVRFSKLCFWLPWPVNVTYGQLYYFKLKIYPKAFKLAINNYSYMSGSRDIPN